MHRAFRAVAFAAAAALAALTSACFAPFSELQGARMVGRGALEVTPLYSSVSFANEGQREKMQTHLGAHVALGVSDRADLRLRLERITMEGDPNGDAFTVLAAGLKYSVMPDRVALFAPIGFATGSGIETSETYQFHPALLLTFPMAPGVDLNPSAKVLIPLSENGDVLWAVNFGLALGPATRRWAVRPEVGFLRNPGESGTGIHASLGFSLSTRKSTP